MEAEEEERKKKKKQEPLVKKTLNVPLIRLIPFFSSPIFFPGRDVISRGHLEADLAGGPL